MTAVDPAPTAIPADRRLSPHAERTGSLARLLATQVAAEVRANLRVPEYLIGVIGVPVILYAMFGLPQAGTMLPGGTDVGAMIFASMSCYGVVSLAIFTFGVDVAQERGRGWLRRLRATPMPMWVYFAGKLVMAAVFTVVILTLMAALAVLVGGVRFDVGRTLRACAILVAGSMAFSTMGFALAFWARPKAASAVGNLLFLPLSFLSGFFYSLAALPQFLQELAPKLPTYHFGQLVWTQMAPARDVVDYGALTPGPIASHLLPLAASVVVFSLLTAWGWRRNVGRRVR